MFCQLHYRDNRLALLHKLPVSVVLFPMRIVRSTT